MMAYLINDRPMQSSRNIKIIDPGEDKRWDEFVLHHNRSTIYHHSLWKELVRKTYGYEPYYFILENNEGHICGGMPFFLIKSYLTGVRLISLAFADFCDPLVYDQVDFDLLLQAVLDKSKQLRASYIEFKTKDSLIYFHSYASCAFKRTNYYKNHILKLLDSSEEVKDKFLKGNIKRNINKALKSNLSLIQAEDEKGMEIFYKLEAMTRKKHGLPPQPYKFFKNLWNIFHPENMLDVLISFEGSKPTASIIIARFKNTMYYLYGGSDSRYLKNRPNHLLLWRAIEMACELGLEYFDFGRTSLDNHGLLKFKRMWGTEEVDISRFWFSASHTSTLLFNRGGMKKDLILRVAQRLPVSLLKVVGNYIYKHMG